MFNYSIIIPHYNAPSLLRRCLKSIPQRDDLQILVVDDCSTDEYRASVDLLKEEFPSILFLKTLKQSGGGAARNVGLSQAEGKYILFIDSDDYFNYCIDDILNEYANTDADIVYFNVNAVDTDLYTQSYRCSHINKMFNLHQLDPDRSEFLMRYAYGEPWGKIISKKMVVDHHISFEETNIHNDTRFSYLTGFWAKNIRVDFRALCCITDRKNSVSKIISSDRLITRIGVFARQYQFLLEHGIHFLDDRIFLSFEYCKKHHLNKEYRACLQEAANYGLGYIALKRAFIRYRYLSKVKKIINKIKKAFNCHV